MTRFALACALALSPASAQAATIYAEDFTGQDGVGFFGSGSSTEVTPDGVDWTITAPRLRGQGDDFGVIDGQFVATDVNRFSTWVSPVIDTSGYTNLSFSMYIFEIGDLEGPEGANRARQVDYFDVSFSLDGGAFLTVEDYLGLGTAGHTLTGDTSLAGPDDADFGAITFEQLLDEANTVQIELSMRVNGRREGFAFDNLTLTGDPLPVVLPASGFAMLAGLALLQVVRRRA